MGLKLGSKKETDAAAAVTDSDAPRTAGVVYSETFRENWKCFVALGFIVLSPFQYGVDFGLIGGLQAMPGFLMVFGHRAPHLPSGWNIDTTRQQLISSLMTLGAFLSSASAGLAAKYMGRKMSLWGACLLCIISNVIMMASTDIGALYVGRLLIGLANGWFMTFSQLYIQECSPARWRGWWLAVFTFCTSFVSLPSLTFRPSLELPLQIWDLASFVAPLASSD